jgi:hypothetical protein
VNADEKDKFLVYAGMKKDNSLMDEREFFKKW